jgi:hypothetical protein
VNLDEVVRKASDHPFDDAEVDAFCANNSISREQFADAVSRAVATGYHNGDFDFGFCDGVMNHLFAFTTMRGEAAMPPYSHAVFLAFDDGEYHHQDDPPDASPEELYTKPQIRDIIGRGHAVT